VFRESRKIHTLLAKVRGLPEDCTQLFKRELKNLIIFFAHILGPNKLTVNDMWRMVWEQRSYSIVMVTSLVELDKVSRSLSSPLLLS
jgi:hypothetical protein